MTGPPAVPAWGRTVGSSAVAAELAGQIGNPAAPMLTRRTATVQSLNNDGTVNVTWPTGQVVQNIRTLDGPPLLVGDVVVLLGSGEAVKDYVILGRVLTDPDGPVIFTGVLTGQTLNAGTPGLNLTAVTDAFGSVRTVSLIPPRPAWYRFTANVFFSASTLGTYRQCEWIENGAASNYGFGRQIGPFANIAACVTVVSCPMFCNGSTDFVQVTGQHDAGVNLTLTGAVGMSQVR